MIFRQPQRCLDPNRQVVWQCTDHSYGQRRLDPLMREPLGRHHHDFALDQLELLVLGDDPGIDHASDVVDGKRPAGETFGGGGDGYIHGGDRVC